MAHNKKRCSSDLARNNSRATKTHMTNIPYQVPASKVSTVHLAHARLVTKTTHSGFGVCTLSIYILLWRA